MYEDLGKGLLLLITYTGPFKVLMSYVKFIQWLMTQGRENLNSTSYS